MAKRFYLLFIVIVFLILVIPFAGMSIYPTNETIENTVLAEWPKLKSEGKWNINYISEMGEYFEDRFAFRPALVTANALLRSNLLSESTDQVIVGSDEWLYFSGTLDDYLGKELFDDRTQFSITHNLKLMQDYVESNGAKFVVMIPPNKNSLYDENMPYYYVKGNDSNYKYLIDNLHSEGISHVDLYQLFNNVEDVFYYKRDSHWNTKGALLAYNALMECVEKEHESWTNVPASDAVHVGDIDKMLFPLAPKEENDISYKDSFTYTYVNDVVDDMDEWIETTCPGKSGCILMYRDSFGEALLPFVANEFEQGYFSQLLPYNLTQAETYKPEVVVIEKTERNLSYFVEEAPIMEPLSVENMYVPEIKTNSLLNVEKSGSYLLMSGSIEEKYLDTDTEIFIAIRDKKTNKTTTYPTFFVMSEEGKVNGFQLYIKENSILNDDIHVSVLVSNRNSCWIVVSNDYKCE